jgi:hypothetical protein
MNQIKFLFVLNEKYKQGGRQYKFIFIFKYPAFKRSYFEKPLKPGKFHLKIKICRNVDYLKKNFSEKIFIKKFYKNARNGELDY